MFCPVCVYCPIRVYGMAHTRIPYMIPICIWDNLLSHMSIFKYLIRMFLYRFYDNSGYLLYLCSTLASTLIAMVIPMVKQCKLSHIIYACGDQSFFSATRSRRSSGSMATNYTNRIYKSPSIATGITVHVMVKVYGNKCVVKIVRCKCDVPLHGTSCACMGIFPISMG